MSDQNKQIARRFIEAFAKGDAVTLEQIVAEDVVDHNPGPATRPGRQGLLDAVAMFQVGFPDITISVEQELAEGDLVVTYGKIAGTNRGLLMGTAPTGKQATFAYMDIYRIRQGLI